MACSWVRLAGLAQVLALDRARDLLLLGLVLLRLGIDKGHVWLLRGALPALLYAYGHEMISTSSRGLFWVIKCLVFGENFVFRDKDPIHRVLGGAGRPIEHHVLVAHQTARFAR